MVERTPIEYVVIILALLAFTAVVLNSDALKTPTSGLQTITVSASGSASSTADSASLYLIINGTGNTTQLAVANLTKTVDAVNSTLSAYLGGNLSTISTDYFNVNKCYNPVYYPSTTIPYYNKTCEYQATTELLVTIPNIKNTTQVLESLVTIPNVYVTDVAAKLTDTQISTLRSEALAMAMTNATNQATAVSPTGHVSIMNITVSSFYIYPFQYSLGSFGGAISPSSAAQQLQTSLFYSGTSSVGESITVVYAVQH